MRESLPLPPPPQKGEREMSQVFVASGNSAKGSRDLYKSKAYSVP